MTELWLSLPVTFMILIFFFFFFLHWEMGVVVGNLNFSRMRITSIATSMFTLNVCALHCVIIIAWSNTCFETSESASNMLSSVPQRQCWVYWKHFPMFQNTCGRAQLWVNQRQQAVPHSSPLHSAPPDHSHREHSTLSKNDSKIISTCSSYLDVLESLLIRNFNLIVITCSQLLPYTLLDFTPAFMCSLYFIVKLNDWLMLCSSFPVMPRSVDDAAKCRNVWNEHVGVNAGYPLSVDLFSILLRNICSWDDRTLNLL